MSLTKDLYKKGDSVMLNRLLSLPLSKASSLSLRRGSVGVVKDNEEPGAYGYRHPNGSIVAVDFPLGNFSLTVWCSTRDIERTGDGGA
jgi:hypothetical protein